MPASEANKKKKGRKIMFIKLFTQILDSSIADNRQLRHLFTDLLLCADVKGIIMMTPAAISRRIGASIEEVNWGLEELQKPDPMSKTPDFNGARLESLAGHSYGWRIVNYESYRAMRDADQMREATKIRVKRYRDKKNNAVTPVTPQVAHGNASQRQSEGEAESESEAPTSIPSADASDGKGELFDEPLPEKKPKKSRCDWNPTPEQKIINGWFARRDYTPWSEKELKAYNAIPHQTILDGIKDMNAYYLSDHKTLRHDILTLLNNWTGEMDRAFKWETEKSKPQKIDLK
jgi:hypothetical protein